MKYNGIKIYSIIISVIAVALAVTLIVVTTEPADKVNADSIMSSEDSHADNDEPGIKDNGDNPGLITDESESSASDDALSVAGEVGWEAGNDNVQNVVNAWKTMLRQMGELADIAFIGDSITNRGDFRQYFPDKKVINLGCGGDTIRGVYNRAEMLQYVNPRVVILMCGVNTLRNDNIEFCSAEYAQLLDSVNTYVPYSKVYVCSILPMGQDWQDEYCAHQTTETFNLIIKDLAESRGMTYVDLYYLFETDGVINPDYTVDGIHLSPAGYDLWMSAIYEYIY